LLAALGAFCDLAEVKAFNQHGTASIERQIRETGAVEQDYPVIEV